MSWVKIFYIAFDVSKDSGRVDLAFLIKAGSSWLRCIKMTRGNISTEIILQFPLKSHQSNKDLEYCYSDIFISLIKLISNFGFCVCFFFPNQLRAPHLYEMVFGDKSLKTSQEACRKDHCFRCSAVQRRLRSEPGARSTAVQFLSLYLGGETSPPPLLSTESL